MASPLVSACFRRFFGASLLVLTASASIAGGSHAFAEALEQRGWHVKGHSNGDILLSPRPPQQPTAVSLPQREHQYLKSLAGRLAATGWRVRRGMDGGVVFWVNEEADHASQVHAESHPRESLAPLGNRLAAAGWQVEHGADGSILFWAADQSDDLPRDPFESSPNDRLTDLGERLVATGWQVGRDADGSILFWADDHSDELPQDPFESNPNDRLTGLGEHLAATGWQVERRVDGSILFWADDGQHNAPKTVARKQANDDPTVQPTFSDRIHIGLASPLGASITTTRSI